jgi:hypothetical protein
VIAALRREPAVDDTLFGRSGCRRVWGAHYLHDGAQPEGSGQRTRWGNWTVPDRASRLRQAGAASASRRRLFGADSSPPRDAAPPIATSPLDARDSSRSATIRVGGGSNRRRGRPRSSRFRFHVTATPSPATGRLLLWTKTGTSWDRGERVGCCAKEASARGGTGLPVLVQLRSEPSELRDARSRCDASFSCPRLPAGA